jgi:tellurite resistance protein TehA-like permease
MKYRIGLWAAAGFLVASGWAVYLLLRNKDHLAEPIVSTLIRLTCPIAIVGSHYPVSLHLALLTNVATYALIGLVVETLRRQLNQSN